MKNEQLAKEILRELVRNAAQTIINDEFGHWHARYHDYCFNRGKYDNLHQEAVSELDRLNGCFEEEEIKKIFDEAEECYRAQVKPHVWALFKDKAQPAASDQPSVRMSEDESPFLGDDIFSQ